MLIYSAFRALRIFIFPQPPITISLESRLLSLHEVQYLNEAPSQPFVRPIYKNTIKCSTVLESYSSSPHNPTKLCNVNYSVSRVRKS